MKKILAILILLTSFGFSQEGVKNEIYNNPSKKELFSRARDVLKKSLESKDFDRAGEAYAYLQSNVNEGAPLTVFEEYLIDMEMGKYADGIRKYANQRRILLDSSYTPEKKNDRFTEKDALNNYLYGKFEPFTEAKADSMVNLVDASDISEELKDLYATMIYGELTVGINIYTFHSNTFLYRNVRDTTRAEQFLERARAFVEKNPYTEHTNYLKNSTIPMVEKVVTRLRDFRKDPLKHKYYTGGIGVFIGQWLGFMTGDITDYFDSEMGSSFIGEVGIQCRRLSLNVLWSYGLIDKPKYENHVSVAGSGESETIGLTLGYTVFDSRFLKAEPFIGVGTYDFLWADADIPTVFMLGANADVRLFATKPKQLGGFSFAIVARFKYMMQIGTFVEESSSSYYDYDLEEYVEDNRNIDAGFIAHQFSLSLGLFLW